jgi:hypothetical protein
MAPTVFFCLCPWFLVPVIDGAVLEFARRRLEPIRVGLLAYALLTGNTPFSCSA